MNSSVSARLRGRLHPAALAVCLAAALSACQTARTGGGSSGAGGASADPQALMGLSPNEVTAMMGQPELRRQEPPAEVWQYRTSTCVFDVYLYDDRVTYFEARHRRQGTVSAPGCLGQIVAARGGGRATS